jgi:NAD(P)-dependent dehydrogenase (short-subunit alcohol dehydrogenase family)
VIGGVEQVALDIARTSFETNVWGTMALAQEALPVMRGQGHGHLVLVSSCFQPGPVTTELERVWGDRTPPGGDP